MISETTVVKQGTRKAAWLVDLRVGFCQTLALSRSTSPIGVQVSSHS